MMRVMPLFPIVTHHHHYQESCSTASTPICSEFLCHLADPLGFEDALPGDQQ
jgi:hypothetical protein